MTHIDERSLDEQLASRFYAMIHRSQRHDFRPFTSLGHEERAPWTAMAREALRVAEWMALKGAESISEDATLTPELTLPPSDWQP